MSEVFANEKKSTGTSLAILWLRLHAPNAGGMGPISGQGKKILHAAGPGQKQKQTQSFPLLLN